MRKLSYAFQVCIMLCVVGLGVFYLVASTHLFPVFGVDSAPHLVPILNLKAGHGLTGVVWPLTRNYDPTNQHRFLQYPPLFHLAVARLILQPTAADVFICLACFAITALVLYAALVLQKCVGDASTPKPLWLALVCLSLFAVSTWLYALPSSGRPEALATPVVLLATFCMVSVRPALRPVVAGVFIGLLGGIQIVTACLFGLLFSVSVSMQTSKMRTPARDWLSQMLVAGVLSLLVFASSFLLSPFGFIETMRGIVVHLRQLPSGVFSVASFYLFPAINGTFYGLFFVILLFHFLWWHRMKLNGLIALNIGTFLVVTWVFAIHHPNRSYNLLVFSPVLMALALHLLAGLDREGSSPDLRRLRRPIYIMYFGIFSLMAVGFLRQVIVFEVFEKHGVSYQEARKQLDKLLPANADTPIMFDNGMWVLLDHFEHAYFNASENLAALEPVPGNEKPILIVHQWYGRWTVPPSVPGYQLIWNDFIEQPSPRMLGIKIGSATPGYAFALYKPTEPAR